MEKVVVKASAPKPYGNVKAHFVLYDDGSINIPHNSDIKINVLDLKNLDKDCKMKPDYKYSSTKEIYEIEQEIELIHLAYHSLRKIMDPHNITRQIIKQEIERHRNLVKNSFNYDNISICIRFKKYILKMYYDKKIKEVRKRHYLYTCDVLYRYLTIKNLNNIDIKDLTYEILMDFRSFLINECDYVDKFPFIYKSKKKTDIPKQPRTESTVINKMKMVSAFLSELEANKEIEISPLINKIEPPITNLGIPQEKIDPILLNKDELLRVLDTDVPEKLLETKDCFLFQCAIGCNVKDYAEINWDNVKIKYGVPFIIYPYHKKNIDETKVSKIPLPLFAYEIIMKWHFNFPILHDLTGKDGYDNKIKQLLEYCNVDRPVAVYDEKSKANEYVPLYSVASESICSKTHDNIINNYKEYLYSSQLPLINNSPLRKYVALKMYERFVLYSQAFDQPLFMRTRNRRIKLLDEGKS